jgi:hypothetical protein
LLCAHPHHPLGGQAFFFESPHGQARGKPFPVRFHSPPRPALTVGQLAHCPTMPLPCALPAACWHSNILKNVGVLSDLARGHKRGQAYNLNIAVSDLLVLDGRGNWHLSPKCYTRQLLLPHSTTPFHSSFKLKYPPCPFLSLQKSPPNLPQPHPPRPLGGQAFFFELPPTPEEVRPFPLRFCPSRPALTVGQLANYPTVDPRHNPRLR